MTISMVEAVTVTDAQLAVQHLIESVGGLSGLDASNRLHEVDQLAAMVDALRVDLIGVVHSSQVWREVDPNGTTASFLRREHKRDHRQAKADVQAAESFALFPQLRQAAGAGLISRAEVDMNVSVGTRTAQRSEALPEFIDIFITLAQQVTMSDLRKTLAPWAEQIDPVTAGGDDHDAHQRRELFVHQLGDGVRLDGFFGPEQGARIMAALNAALSAHWRASQEQSPVDRTASTSPTVSTAAQRADAFIEAIINPILETQTLPSCGGSPATVCVITPLERLADPNTPVTLEALKGRIVDGTIAQHSTMLRTSNGPGEFVVSTTTAQKLSCDSTVQRVVVSPAGKPLNIGRKARVIPEQIRTALVIRDGGCRFPYCSKPAGWAEGHHVTHWSQGGPTSLDNLILLCSRHHHQVHSQGIPIEFDDDGIPRVKLEHHFNDRL